MPEVKVLMDELVLSVHQSCIEQGVESPRFAICFFPPELPDNAYILASNVPPEALGLRKLGPEDLTPQHSISHFYAFYSGMIMGGTLAFILMLMNR